MRVRIPRPVSVVSSDSDLPSAKRLIELTQGFFPRCEVNRSGVIWVDGSSDAVGIDFDVDSVATSRAQAAFAGAVSAGVDDESVSPSRWGRCEARVRVIGNAEVVDWTKPFDTPAGILTDHPAI